MSKNTDLWVAYNDRIQDGIDAGSITGVNTLFRGIRPTVYRECPSTTIMTFLDISADTRMDSENRRDKLNLAFLVATAVMDETHDYIKDLIEVRDEVLNVLEKDSSGNQELKFGNSAIGAWEITSDIPRIMEPAGKIAIVETIINIGSNFYQPGSR